MREVYELLRPRERALRVSAEIERLPLRQGAPGAALRYEPAVRGLLEELVARRGWRETYRASGALLAAADGERSASVEPGGQLEVSAPPRATVGEWWAGQEALDAELAGTEALAGARLAAVGLNPWEAADAVPLLPSPRYALMDAHFGSLGGRGREMMRLSCALQVNLDYASEEEAVRRLRAGLFLAAPLGALFCNSPFWRGSARGALSQRQRIWAATDAARCGALDALVDEGLTLARYAELAARVPLLYAFDAGGEAFDPGGRGLAELKPALREGNALPALRQLFTDARLKPGTVELRFFDAVPLPLARAAAALAVGLLYDEECLRAVLARAPSSARALRESLLRGAERGLGDAELRALAEEWRALAARALARRGTGEEAFLEPAERLLRDGRTPAEAWLARGRDDPP